MFFLKELHPRSVRFPVSRPFLLEDIFMEAARRKLLDPKLSNEACLGKSLIAWPGWPPSLSRLLSGVAILPCLGEPDLSDRQTASLTFKHLWGGF